MRTCLKATPAIGAARETMEAVAGAMAAVAVPDSVASAGTEAEVVFAEREPVARRVVIAGRPTDLQPGAPVNAGVLEGTGEAAETAVDSGDAMTAIADRVTRLPQRWPV
jgi:hypothetical protein